MFREWFQYGTTEVANNQRVETYVANGLRPVGAVISGCSDCPGLAEAAGESGPYDTPALDDAPWFNPRDDNSVSFAGVHVVEVTGLEGSTVEASVAERLGDGGILGTRRATSRTVAVTADVVGSTPAGADYGLEWLSAALHPPCVDGADCAGDTLHLFSACPAACEGLTDEDSPRVKTNFSRTDQFQSPGLFSTNSGVYNAIPDPIGAGAALTDWYSPPTAGAHRQGAVARGTSGSGPRNTLVTLTSPALGTAEYTSVRTEFTAPEAGWYELSCWVSLGTSWVSCWLTDFEELSSYPTDRRGVWVRLSFMKQMAAGETSYLGLRTSNYAPPGTGAVLSLKAAMARPKGGFAAPQGGGRTDSDSAPYGDSRPPVIRNLFTNPSFRNNLFGSETWPGSGGVGAVSQWVSQPAPNAVGFRRITWSTALGTTLPTGGGGHILNGWGSDGTGFISVKPGRTLYVSGRIRCSHARSIQVQVQFYDAAGSPTSSGGGAIVALSPGIISEVSGEFMVPAGSTQAQVRFYLDDSPMADVTTLDLDGVLVHQSGVAVSYFETVNGGQYSWWEGVPHQSVSVTFGPTLDGWTGTPGSTTSTDPGLVQVVSSTSAPSGSARAVEIQWSSALSPGTSNHAAYTRLVGLEVGQVYTIAASILVNAGSPDVVTDVRSGSVGAPMAVKGAWVRVSHTFAAKDPEDWFGIQTTLGSGGSVLVDNLRISPGFSAGGGSPIETPQPSTYFDGASTDAEPTNLVAGQAAVPGAVGTVITPHPVGVEAWFDLRSSVSEAVANVPAMAPTLVRGREYHASWEVYNDGASTVPVSVLWIGNRRNTVQVPPREHRRIYVRGMFDGGTSPVSLRIPGNTSILFRNPWLEPVQPRDFSWVGAPDDSASQAAPLGTTFVFQPTGDVFELLGPVMPPVCDNVQVVWTLASPSGMPFRVTPGWADSTGEIISWGVPQMVTADLTNIVLEAATTPNFPGDWRPVLYVRDPDPNVPTAALTVHALDVWHRRLLEVDECIDQYRRSLRNVVTVSGPKVLEWLTLGDTTSESTVARVEWTWVAMEPHVWHTPMSLVRGAQARSAAVVSQAPGVPLTAPQTVSGAGTTCPVPAVQATTCADIPSLPATVLPPQPPRPADPAVMVADQYSRRRFEVPEDLAPAGLGALTWKFTNDAKPKFGIRVRVWADTQPAPDPEAECAWMQEFTITYLGPNQVLTVDGTSGDVLVLCADGSTVSALRNMRGPYGGPFNPTEVVGCGRPLVVAVDVPQTYTDPVLTGQPNGSPQGDLTWSVDLTRRA